MYMSEEFKEKLIKYRDEINRKTKEQIVEQLSGDLKTANSAIFVDYKGLTVEEATELRNCLLYTSRCV